VHTTLLPEAFSNQLAVEFSSFYLAEVFGEFEYVKHYTLFLFCQYLILHQ